MEELRCPECQSEIADENLVCPECNYSFTGVDPSSERKRILLVDDDLHLIKMIEEKLRAKKFDVMTAVDGKDAVDTAKLEEPDLIVLDIMMPEMDGYEVLRVIRRDRVISETPVIMMSGLSDIDSILKAQQLNATDYVIKPFEPPDLLEMIQKYV